MTPKQLDDSFKEFMHNLPSWTPEGVIEVNLQLLDRLGLLETDSLAPSETEEELPHYFHVVETSEKITLFNHQFSVWIVPKVVDETPVTLVLISLLTPTEPHLEIVFSTSGVYNTPQFVLKLIRHYLAEVIENEEAIATINAAE